MGQTDSNAPPDDRKVVAVTGATSGIGLAIAKRHLSAGDRVVIGDIRVDASAEELGLDPAQCKVIRTDVTSEADVEALVAWAREAGLPLIGIDNVPGSVSLEGYPLPRARVLVLGQEGTGLSTQAQEACDAVLHIRQFGSTRSINAGAAAAIAMHTWITQHA